MTSLNFGGDCPAFNKTIARLSQVGKRLEDFTYDNVEIKNELYDAMNATEFLGVSVSQL